MAGSNSRARALTALAIINGVKLVVRYGLFTMLSPLLIETYAGFDAIAILLLAPWVAAAPPLPRSQQGAIRRALIVAIVLPAALSLVNLLLQLQLLWQRSTDPLQFVLEVLLIGIPRSVAGGYLGGVLLAIVAAVISFGVLQFFMPRRPRSALPAQGAINLRRDAPSARPTGRTQRRP